MSVFFKFRYASTAILFLVGLVDLIFSGLGTLNILFVSAAVGSYAILALIYYSKYHEQQIIFMNKYILAFGFFTLIALSIAVHFANLDTTFIFTFIAIPIILILLSVYRLVTTK